MSSISNGLFIFVWLCFNKQSSLKLNFIRKTIFYYDNSKIYRV
jgi:ammonia channel protein AmtB